MSSNDSWFKWEREASIHLLFPTLEGSMEPLRKYVGFGFPTCILFFKNGVVTWCLKENDFYKFGAKLRKIYTDPVKEKRMVANLKTSLKKLQDTEKLVKHARLQKINDKQLISLYRKLYDNFLEYYAIGAISTPLSSETEQFLQKNTKLPDEQINLLSAPSQDSYSKQAEKYLLKTQNVQGFIDQYFWIDNNYANVKTVTTQEVESRLRQLKNSHQEIKKSKPPKKIGNKFQRLFELLRNYSIYKDERKKNILIYLHFLNLILNEAAKRSKLTKDEIRNTFPTEIKKVLGGKLKAGRIRDRKKLCVVLWKENVKKPEVLTGQKAKKWEGVLLGTNLISSKTIVGKTASPGKVRGKVRILLSSKDCSKFKGEEVLVTFMTSPDFLPAMRKAKAIITNLGGVTSHAAIISRELGIPCIVGTKFATQVLKTGDLVEVDANAGVVKILN